MVLETNRALRQSRHSDDLPLTRITQAPRQPNGRYLFDVKLPRPGLVERNLLYCLSEVMEFFPDPGAPNKHSAVPQFTTEPSPKLPAIPPYPIIPSSGLLILAGIYAEEFVQAPAKKPQPSQLKKSLSSKKSGSTNRLYPNSSFQSTVWNPVAILIPGIP